MEQRISPLTFLLSTLIGLAVLLSASVMLPHDRYYRFQAHDTVTTRKADWIYERLHFDPMPVDVALIGTSRMVGGLSSPQIEREYCKATGRRIHVANLALPMTGRNMHYALAKEATETKSPTLFVVELNDVESRRPHEGFIFLADAKDVLSAPIALNLNYLSDLLRLPGRQASLFLQTVTGNPVVRDEFDHEAYSGAHLDLTSEIEFIGGQTKSRDVVKSRQEMEALLSKREEKMSPAYLLPEPLRSLEYRFSRYYLRKIEALAAQKNANVAYAYLPAYQAPDLPAHVRRALRIEEPSFDLGGAIAEDAALWLDATHVNADGARAQSRRFAEQLAAQHPDLGQEGCAGQGANLAP